MGYSPPLGRLAFEKCKYQWRREKEEGHIWLDSHTATLIYCGHL
jgi:hypothetical protein